MYRYHFSIVGLFISASQPSLSYLYIKFQVVFFMYRPISLLMCRKAQFILNTAITTFTIDLHSCSRPVYTRYQQAYAIGNRLVGSQLLGLLTAVALTLRHSFSVHKYKVSNYSPSFCVILHVALGQRQKIQFRCTYHPQLHETQARLSLLTLHIMYTAGYSNFLIVRPTPDSYFYVHGLCIDI